MMTIRMPSRRVVVCALVTCVSALVAAPPTPDADAAARSDRVDADSRRSGWPAAHRSSITNVGTDSNVFNTAENPQDDFTATIVPRLVARVRAGRLLFSYGAATDFVYFKEFKDEESVNFGSDVRLDANLGRLQPYVSTGWVSTKDRLNAELDVRAPRTQRTIMGGARILVASRTSLVVNARRFDLDFDEGTRVRRR